MHEIQVAVDAVENEAVYQFLVSLLKEGALAMDFVDA